MRQIVKRVKNGEDITFTCSRCGNFVHNMFVPTGKKCESDWDKIPEKCSCGERLTNRQPIIDEEYKDVQAIDDVHKNVHKGIDNIHKNIDRGTNDDVRMGRDGYERNVRRSIYEKKDISEKYIIDLENAISIGYFDMRLNSIKNNGLKIPDNIDSLRIECIKRNISHIESNVKQLQYKDSESGKRELQEQLNVLRQEYSDYSKKLDDRKDINKKNIKTI